MSYHDTLSEIRELLTRNLPCDEIAHRLNLSIDIVEKIVLILPKRKVCSI